MKNAEMILRSIPTTEKIFRSARRVRSITAAACVEALSKNGYGAEEIKEEIQKLLASYKIVKVKVSERNPHSVDLQYGKVMSALDVYVWAEDENSKFTVFIGILFIVLVMLIVMFRLWPVWLKRVASYAKYPIVGFTLFLLAAGCIRATVFAITYFTHPPGLWLLPNLFADCGFFESFVPAYSWAGQDVSHKKKVKLE